MMTTGNPISAEQAKDLGLVDEIIAGRPPCRGDRVRQEQGRQAAAAHPRSGGEAGRRSEGVLRPGARPGGEGIERLSGAAPASWTAPRRRPRSRSTKDARSSARTSTSSSPAPNRRRCATCSSPSARPPSFRTCPEDTPVREINTAAVVGAGTMGGGIAMCFANAGIPVTLVDTTQEALDRGLNTIRKNYAGTVSKGRLTQSDMDKRMGLIRGSANLGDTANADIVIEAVFERMDVKQELFRKLDGIVKPGAILATNTSTLDVDQIAAATDARARRRRHALLLARERHAAARGRARQAHRQRCSRDHAQARQAAEEGAGGFGRMRRLHRQPHAREVRPAGPVSPRRGREPAAGRRRAAELGHGDGPVRDVRHRGPGHRLGDPQAALPGAPGFRVLAHRRPHLRARALRAENRQGDVQVRAAGKPQAHPGPRSRQAHLESTGRKSAYNRAQSPTTRSSSAASTRW